MKAAVASKKKAQEDNKVTIGNIRDNAVREQVTDIPKMFESMQKRDEATTTARFGELRCLSKVQATRMDDLIATVMNQYKTDDPGRFEPLQNMLELKSSDQVAPASDVYSLEDKVRFLLSRASCQEQGFRDAMVKIANGVNGAMSCREM